MSRKKTIITVYSAKGGVGKTTTSINLSAALAECGKKVLIIDGDFQGNVTFCMGLDPRDEKTPALPQLLMNQINNPNSIKDNLDTYIHYIEKENFYIIPTNPRVTHEEFRRIIADPINRYCLRDFLNDLDFDFVIIDTPAVLDSFLNLALVASDSVIVTVIPEFLSYDSLESTFGIIKAIRQQYNPKLNIVGILLNKFNSSNRSSQLQEMMQDYADDENIFIFNTMIPQRNAIHDIFVEKESIFRKRSNAKELYLSLASEVITLSEKKIRQEEE